MTHGTPSVLNTTEPEDIAASVQTLGLKYVVLTSVTRDDIPDGGASVFSHTIHALRRTTPETLIEVLIPDFKGDETALQTVIDATPDVMNHNIEVVEELFPRLRPQGSYQRSIQLLSMIKTKTHSIPTKSGLMLGLGESTEQILRTLRDLRKAQVDFLTIGQYLQPTASHVPIQKYYTPLEFLQMKESAVHLGFTHVESGPLVRSSVSCTTCPSLNRILQKDLV